MKRTTIGGAMNYARLSQVHRPADPQALAKEVRRLASTGLTATDIATALRLNLAAVREMLGRT